MNAQFGYFPRKLNFEYRHIRIATLPELEEKVSILSRSSAVQGKWIYAPRVVQVDSNGKRLGEALPRRRVFSLPKTHTIALAQPKGERHLEFLIWCLSFFVGMRLTTTDAGFVDATPLQPATLTDFTLHGSSEVDALAIAEAFWDRAPEWNQARLVVTAVHALFHAQSPTLFQYERFFHLYAALDAVYAYLRDFDSLARGPHSQRVEAMCQHFYMPVPEWAKYENNQSLIATLRNPAFHEAQFAGEPLGFAIYSASNPAAKIDQSIFMEMEALACRFLVAVLGRPDCEYVKSAVTSQQQCGLNLR